MNRAFSHDDLVPVEWQFSVYHELGSEFKKGEKVFLKSNPDVSLKVIDFHKERVICSYWNVKNIKGLFDFNAAQVIRYSEAAFVEYYNNREIKICLN